MCVCEGDNCVRWHAGARRDQRRGDHLAQSRGSLVSCPKWVLKTIVKPSARARRTISAVPDNLHFKARYWRPFWLPRLRLPVVQYLRLLHHSFLSPVVFSAHVPQPGKPASLPNIRVRTERSPEIPRGAEQQDTRTRRPACAHTVLPAQHETERSQGFPLQPPEVRHHRMSCLSGHCL